MGKMVIKTEPTIEPVSLSEFLDHIRMDYEDELPLVRTEAEKIIKAARQHAEHILDRAIMTQTWYYYLDSFPAENAFLLPKGNLVSVTSVAYTDYSGSSTTMTVTTDYLVETNGVQHGRIVLPYGESWPSATLYPSNPITVEFVCGWASAAAVPNDIKAGIMMIAADLWENRSRQNFSGGMSFMPNPTAINLMWTHRLGWRSL